LRPTEDIFYNLTNKMKHHKVNGSTHIFNIRTIYVLRLFIKIFSIFSIFLIAYYGLGGLQYIELIYSKKWSNNQVLKYGIAYSIFMTFLTMSETITCYTNAISGSRQMYLTTINLIINGVTLIISMLTFTKWDLSGIIIANSLASLVKINGLLYIIFCGKNKEENIDQDYQETSLKDDVMNFLEKYFITIPSLISVFISICIGHYLKSTIDPQRIGKIALLTACVGAINLFIVILIERKKFRTIVEEIKKE
jgi:hypothetical protein